MRIHQERGQPRTALLFAAAIVACAAPAMVLSTVVIAAQATGGWLAVGSNQRATVSGIARVDDAHGALRFLIVHDNKNAGEARLALVTLGVTPRYTQVPWPPSGGSEGHQRAMRRR